MLVRIWGCRGSIPVATNSDKVQSKLRRALMAGSGRVFENEEQAQTFIEEELPWPVGHSYGGNSSCVQIETGADSYTICDLGSGVREFGGHMMKTHGPAKPQSYNIFMSHLHWDHIMGFPFFPPAYIPGNKLRIYSCHPDPRAAFIRQQSEPCFPVTMDMMGADIEFIEINPDEPFVVDGTTVTAVKQYHGGESYGYRFERDEKIVVYSTDSEHKLENQEEIDIFINLFKEADVVIFDAQYSLADTQTLKEDWGHSSNIIGVELCHEAKAKHLVLYHHEPTFDDDTIHKVFEETIRYEEIMRPDEQLHVTSAYDGLEIRI